MISYFKKSSFALLVALLCAACNKPTDNLKIVVDANIIKYSALVHITDAQGISPANLTLTVTGQDADAIYEISGKKNFTVTGGIITIGASPVLTPSNDKPVKFNVNITAPGYVAVTQAVQINAGQMQQVVNLNMVKVNAPQTPVMATPVVVPTVNSPVSVNFIGTCINKPDFELRPSIYVFYKETGTNNPFQYLGYMDKGSLVSTAITTGKTYDFEITYAGINYTTTRKIDQANISEKMNMGDLCSNF